MINNTLHISDVMEIILLCALIFIPLGFYIARNFDYVLRILNIKRLSPPNLRDRGSIQSFLNAENDNNTGTKLG